MTVRNRRIRVLVADDSPTALRSVCKFLQFQGEFELAGTAYDGQHLLHQAERIRPDLVLVDLSMPQKNGLEATKELRKAFPEMRVLVYSQLSGLALREECLRWGAHGFVEKSHMPETLMQEVHRLFPEKSQSD
ncbi:MAG TPA: response regulator transcription factor [Candidatus Acidoferrum sp.]|nr:response regulator transcription factor [Candidatus Acidoferrum sp.]